MQTSNPRIQEPQPACPRCKTGKLEYVPANFFLCSECGEIYRESPSGFKRLTVDPVSDLSSYPEVVVDPYPPFCDCRLREYLEYFFFRVGAGYCPKHNVISVGAMYGPKNVERMDKITESLMLQETLHWLLGRTFGEPASYWLENETVSKLLEICFLETTKN